MTAKINNILMFIQTYISCNATVMSLIQISGQMSKRGIDRSPVLNSEEF